MTYENRYQGLGETYDSVAVMNIMCDMTQFIIVAPIPNETAVILIDHFIQHVHTHFVILNDSRPFKGVFSVMCKALNINIDILASVHHNCLLVDKFHRFIKKIITIAAEDRGTNNVFVATGVTARYACNSFPINETSILRSVLAIG